MHQYFTIWYTRAVQLVALLIQALRENKLQHLKLRYKYKALLINQIYILHYITLHHTIIITIHESTAVGQSAACAPVTQRARVRSPVGTSFMGEVFTGFFLTCKTNVGSFRPPRSPNIIWPSLSSIIIHYGRQWPEMLTRPNTTNIYIYIYIYIYIACGRVWWKR